MAKKKTGSKIRTKQAKSAQKLKIRRRRPLHKKILLHPITLFILLCVGVLLVSITYKTYAGGVQVVAKISAPLPTTPASITDIVPSAESKTNQPVISIKNTTSNPQSVYVSSNLITLQGKCPSETYINIYRNNIFAGATMCVDDPIFSIQISLLPGKNVLAAQVFNTTDDKGPILPALTVIYNQPTSSSPTTPTTNNAGSSKQSSSNTNLQTSNQPQLTSKASAFIITSKYQYKSILVGGTYSLEIITGGGSLPYALDINWGDGKQLTLVQKDATTFSVSHVYESAGTGEHQDFTIKIQGSDSANQTAFLQTMAIVKSKSSPVTVANINNKTGLRTLLGSTKRWLLIAWPAYTIITLMATSFWLGEREEFILLRKRNRLHGRRA